MGFLFDGFPGGFVTYSESQFWGINLAKFGLIAEQKDYLLARHVYALFKLQIAVLTTDDSYRQCSYGDTEMALIDMIDAFPVAERQANFQCSGNSGTASQLLAFGFSDIATR